MLLYINLYIYIKISSIAILFYLKNLILDKYLYTIEDSFTISKDINSYYSGLMMKDNALKYLFCSPLI